tara:strand:+ start:473 stop:805 length:333 start_codon:yes stop_codon:yes gene_type:complete
MTRERYLEMCEQLGKEPKEDEIPPDFDDFPDIVPFAVNIFNLLGDRVVADIGYLGKDYTNLPTLIQAYEIDDVEFLLEILNYLDSRAIERSQESMKREREKLKRKTSGPK